MGNIRISAKSISEKFAGIEVTVISDYLKNGSCKYFKATISKETYTDENGISYLLIKPQGEVILKPYTVEYIINSGNNFSKVNNPPTI